MNKLVRGYIILCTVLVTVAILNGIVEKSMGYELAISMGESMCPSSGLLSMTLLKDFDYANDEIVVGQIYTYPIIKTDDYYGVERGCVEVVHRATQKREYTSYDIDTGEEYNYTHYIFRGDNNGFDEIVDKEEILEKQVFELTLIPCWLLGK